MSEFGKFSFKSANSKKRKQKSPFTKEGKRNNRKISKKRIFIENTTGFIKRFRVVSDKCKKTDENGFGLRFSLIAGICNFEPPETRFGRGPIYVEHAETVVSLAHQH
ncbi:MAG: hypothetical protein LBH37_02725 [Oscillospiraceae bacterium]|nr:hypothetical protein [Oscillospiraceae bacterium]